MSKPLIEGCVDSYASAAAATRGGADRLELCGHLVIGGVTPSLVLFKQVQRDCPVRIHVLIRPRFGDFLYSPQEMEEMQEEIKIFRKLGAGGVVIGALTREGELDTKKMEQLIDCAGDMDITLHRAFDMTRDPFAALEAAVSLGCHTILTSGQAGSAEAGRELLKALRAKAAGRIEIMAGCGVGKRNIRMLHEYAGISHFHTSARRGALDSGMLYRKSGVSMGLPFLSEYEVWQTDEEEFRECAGLVHALDAPEARESEEAEGTADELGVRGGTDIP